MTCGSGWHPMSTSERKRKGKRFWTWIRHILRGERSSDCMLALGCRAESEELRRIAEKERRKASWNDRDTVRAKDRDGKQ